MAGQVKRREPPVKMARPLTEYERWQQARSYRTGVADVIVLIALVVILFVAFYVILGGVR